MHLNLELKACHHWIASLSTCRSSTQIAINTMYTQSVSIMAVRITSDLTLPVVIMLCVSELCCTNPCGLFECVS